MVSTATGAAFTDAELRAVLNGNQTPQQRIGHMKHIVGILKAQQSAAQLSEAAKLNIQEMLRTLQSKIALAEQGESLASGVRPPPQSRATAAATGAPVGASMGCPCPELVAAIQALGATMGSAGSAAIQAQITAIQQQLAALQAQSTGLADAERRVQAADARSNAAQAEVSRLQGELTRARAAATTATAAGSSSSAPDRSAEIASLTADLAAARAELATARTDLATARADLATARADLATAQGELTASAAQHTNAITLKDGEIAGLTANINTLTAQIAAIQATTAQSASNASASVDELRQTSNQLMAQLEAATTAHAEEKAGLEAQLAATNALHVQQQAAAAKCNQELAKLKSDQEVFLGNMELAYGKSTFQEISDGYLAVTTELSEAKRGRADADARIAELEPINATLTSESGSKTEEIERLRADLETLTATSDTRIAEAATSSEAEAAAKAELTERLAAAEAAKAACDAAAVKTAADLASLRGELDAVRAALDAKTRVLETAERSAGESNRILEDLRRLLPKGDLKDSIRSLQNQLEAVTAAKTVCDGTLADKTTKLEQIQNEIAQKAAQITTIQSALDAEKLRSVGLNDQLKAAQEKTAANVAAARATATTAQQSALDDMRAQLLAATGAAEKARTDCEISIQLKDGKIANLEAQVQHYINRCGNVLQKVAKIDRAVEERSIASSIDASSGVPQTYASAAAKAPHTTVPVGRGGGTKPVSVVTKPSASFEGVEFAHNPLYSEKTSLLPSSSGTSSGTNLFRRFGLGGATRKNGRKTEGNASLTSNPMFTNGAELLPRGKTSASAGGGSKSVTPIKSGISKVAPQPSFASAEFGNSILNPLRSTTSPTPETASVPAVSVRSPPAAPGGKSSAQSTDGTVSVSNPFAGNKKLQTKKRGNNYKRKTRKNRK